MDIQPQQGARSFHEPFNRHIGPEQCYNGCIGGNTAQPKGSRGETTRARLVPDQWDVVFLHPVFLSETSQNV